MNSDIFTLTMNPAVDVCASVDRIVPIHKLRCGSARRDAGGGGINVARVVRRMGGNPTAIFPAGGPVGQLLRRLVDAENVAQAIVPISADTREDFTVDETATGMQFRFVLPGPFLSQEEQCACLSAVASRLTASSYLVASGSLPPGVSPEHYAHIAEIASSAGAKMFLDSSGTSLRAALGRGVYLIKPSLREFEELVGTKLPDERARLTAARNLVSGGKCSYVALSMGAEGAILVGAEIALGARAPRIEPVSTVGAGDSFLGAFAWAFAQHQSPRDALKLAVAAGSAALLSPGTDLCHRADIDRLARGIEVKEM